MSRIFGTFELNITKVSSKQEGYTRWVHHPMEKRHQKKYTLKKGSLVGHITGVLFKQKIIFIIGVSSQLYSKLA